MCPCLADFCKALCGHGLGRRPTCRRSAQTEFFTAPSPTDHRPGRSGNSISRCSDTSCATNRPLDSSWLNVYIRPLSCSRKVFLSLRLRKCCSLFPDLGVSKGNNSDWPDSLAESPPFRRRRVVYSIVNERRPARTTRVPMYQIDPAFSSPVFWPYPSRSLEPQSQPDYHQ